MDKAGHRLIPTPLGYIYEHREFGPTRGSIFVEEDVDKGSSKSGQKRCKGDKVSLGDNRGATRGEYVFKEFDLVRKCILPSGSLHSNLNRLCSYYWKEKPRSFILEELVVSSELSHTIFILDSTTCDTKEHVKLVDRLSDPSDSSSIESYICPRNRYWANQTLPVSF